MMTTLAAARSPLVLRTPLRSLANTGFSTCKGIIHKTILAGSLQVVRAEPQGEERRPPPNTEFGYSRKDVIIIGAALLGLGYAIYYGMQAFFGVDPLMAGNFTQLIIFVGLCVGWIGSYISRVANKKMTYVTQLEDYETAVMQKRLEEMTEEELDKTLKDADK